MEENVKGAWARYVSPESVSDSLEFTISVLLLWLSSTIFYNMCLRWVLTYKGYYHLQQDMLPRENSDYFCATKH